MAKSVLDAVLDAALDYVADNGDIIYICSDEPTNLTEATTTYALADIPSLTSGDYTGPANGDSSGRKIAVNQQTGVTIDTGGTATHVAVVDAATALLYVTTCTSQALTGGNTLTMNAWDIEIADPT